MRLVEIHLYSVELPLAGGAYEMASTTVEALTSTLVQLVAEDGTTGWGETCPVGPVYAPQHAGGAMAALSEMAPGLLGAQVDQPLTLGRRMDNLLNGHAYAKAAIDIAAHDLCARSLGIRVCDLLGGAEREVVPAYHASGVGAPEEVARQVAERVAEGYSRIQIKVGGRPVEADIETFKRVCERIGPDMPVAVDANRRWTTTEAIRFSNCCAHLPCVLEQPCNSLEEIAAIRPMLRHPVYLDESSTDLPTITRAATNRLCDGFGIKLTRLGGLGPMRTIRDVLEAHRLPHTVDDAWGSDIIAAACTHMAATVSPRLLDRIWIAEPHLALHYDPVNPVRAKAGQLHLPQGPGLGITPDPIRIGRPVASFTHTLNHLEVLQ